MAFLDGLSLVVLDTEDIGSLHLARRLIQSYGGTVAVMSPPSVLIGWVPFEIRDELIGKAGIQEVRYTEVLPGDIQTSDSRSRAMIGFFNAAVRGEIATEHLDLMDRIAAGEPREPRGPDVLTPEAIEHEAYIENLRSAGLDVDVLVEDGLLISPSSPATMGNSDYMTGTVAVTLFFVESDGSGSDPDEYTWIPQHMQGYINGVTTALAWWSNRASSHGDCWVTFLINYYSGADPRCQQWVEPILHNSSWEDIWVNEIMDNFGYTSGSRFTKVNAFNTWQRSYYETDRAYSAFVPYNPAPAAPMFPGGDTAYAYWYGPYTVLLFRVQGWTTAEVFAHESGHIFGACDEYTGGCSGGSCTSVCTNGALNGNCEACNPASRDCMMKANSFRLCSFTPTHVGWEVTVPCAPPEPPLLPSPVVTTVYPSHGFHGLDTSFTIGGTNFFHGASVDMGADVFVHTTTIIGEESLKVDVSIAASAPPGLLDVTVFNRDDQFDIISDAVEILPTTRHYYSPGGGNSAPFITPDDAATTLQEAIDATYEGDTLFVPTETWDDFSMIIEHGLLFHGAWNADFTERDLDAGKTVINLDGNITFSGTVEAAGLDGFVLTNGTGAGDLIPFVAVFGGAVRFLGGSAAIANCEIHTNTAGDAMNYGVGGGIYAQGCDVVIRDTHFHTNSSTQGGAVYLLDCTGTLSNNTFSGNSLTGFVDPLLGGGVAIINSPGIMLNDNTFTGNIGSEEGGGLYVDGSSNVALTGGEFANNEASFSGGGANISGSTVVVNQVQFSVNSSDVIGGGLSISDSPDATVSGSFFSSNSAALGGGLYVAGDVISIRHNLATGNDASNSGGALLVSVAASGEVIGNTLDQNTSSAVGGLSVSGTGTDVFNNIVVNNTGTGISAIGSPPTLTHNLVWANAGGDYSGCTPGEGSLSDDPIFIDPSTGDYHLGLHSPAIDAGKPDEAFADPDGSRGDLGVYGSHSFVMEQPSYPKNFVVEISGNNVQLTWDRNPEDDVAYYTVYCDSTEGFVPSISNYFTMVPGTDSTATIIPPADSVYFRISAMDTGGYAGGYSDEALPIPPTSIGKGNLHYPFALRQNVPNPFNPSTRISYELPSRDAVSLKVYDVNGRLVRTLVGVVQGPGSFSVEWTGTNDNGEPVASGVYFYRLQAGSFVDTKKMVFLK